MNKLVIYAKLCLAAVFIFVAIGCFSKPQNECELTEANGKNILGINVVPIDKNNPALGDPSKAKNDKDLRACGYVPENPTDHGNRPAEGFCDRVPADYEFAHTEKWKTEQCEAANLDEASSGCGYVFEQQINFCSRKS